MAEALAEELAVALPDGLVVFDAKGRITRMNKAALTLLGMEAPAKGKAFLGRKPAEVLPSALAELAAKLLQEPVLPDTEIILRHGEEQQYISVRGGHVNEGYEGRLGSLMFLRDLKVRRLRRKSAAGKSTAVGNLAAASPMSCAIRSAPSRVCDVFRRAVLKAARTGGGAGHGQSGASQSGHRRFDSFRAPRTSGRA
ncbi:MAG: PAS domain-containing protein [Bilophila wadsworthia]